jgi:predicted lipid carrier protein YhbT
MPDFLSTDWFSAARDVVERRVKVQEPAFDVRLAVTVTGAPQGDVQWHAVLRDGALEAFDAGALADADVSLTLPYAEAVAVYRGELDPSVAYMQGRMKTAGDPGKLLRLLAATATPDYAELRSELAGITGTV